MIVLTDTASTKVAELLEAEEQPDLFLRVAVRPGGCSGLSYEMFFDSERASDDVETTFGAGVKVVVDGASAQYLDGASLDRAGADGGPPLLCPEEVRRGREAVAIRARHLHLANLFCVGT